MVEQTLIKLAFADAPIEDSPHSYVYHALADGRLVPVERGGLVEFALFELEGQLVEAVEEFPSRPLVGLN